MSTILFVTNPTLASGSYCDGHRDGHKAYYKTEGGGYPGYGGCPGDPGSSGGNATPYERGFKDGMIKGSRENN